MNEAKPIRRVIKRDGQLVAYDADRVATAIFKAAAAAGGEDRATADALVRQVETRLVEMVGPGGEPTVEDIQDLVEAVLMQAGHLETARAYIIYRHEHARRRAARVAVAEAADHVPYRKIYEVLRWNMDHGCESVDSLNRLVADGRFPELVSACERRYAEEVDAAAAAVQSRVPGVRVVIVAGPSSSGKTTTTLKLGEALRRAGLELVAINLDHYFFDLEEHPKDEFGDYDYETPQALDLDLINRHLAALLDGQTIRTPHYDFQTGRRTLEVHEMRLEKHQLLLIDSLHGLYEGMTSRLPPERKFKLYIETLGQFRNQEGLFMRWADHRLMRRMIRDSWHRHHEPGQTLTHWHYVRASELKHIIPYIGTADFCVNSALPYELPLLKKRLFPYFPEAVRRYQDDPKRQDAYLRARRIRDLLDPLTEAVDETCVPPRSLLREFIGGSAYAY